jgi:hypothetical protein
MNPSSRHETIEVYGDPTRGGLYLKVPDPHWVKDHIVELHGDDRIPEIPERFYFQCHRLVEPSVRAAFTRAKGACPEYVVKVAASFVFRHMRHDPRLPLSVHSFGAAVDIDPDDNQAQSFPHGHTPEPWSESWMHFWPHGLPQAYVEAWEAEGWEWGGRWPGFVDPMHFQRGR